MKKKKQQHIPRKLTEAQVAVDQNVEGWKQTPRPSKFLVITALVCFIGCLLMATLWATAANGDKWLATEALENQIDYLTEAYFDKVDTTSEMIQLLMVELDWPVRLEDDQWWFDCREQLGLE